MITKEKYQFDDRLVLDNLEGLGDRLYTMKVVTGLCRTEKETLEEASKFILSVVEYLKSEVSKDVRERIYQDFTWK